MSKKVKVKKTVEELLEEAIVPKDQINNYNVPENWIYFTFTSILDVQGGTQPPKSEFIDEEQEGYVRLVQIRDFATDKYKTYVPDTPKLRKIEEEDILIARYGASIGRILTGLSGAYNVALTKVVFPKEKIHPRYLFWLLKTEHFQKPLMSISRSAQSGFNKNDLSYFKMPLPPYNEQIRIADKVERLLNKIDEAKQLIDEAKETFELRRAAILDKAFRGDLTLLWRSENPDLESTEHLVERIKFDKEKVYEENCKKAEKEGTRKPRKTKVKIEKSDFESLFEGLPTNWKVVYFDEITAAKENALKAGPFGSALKKEFYVPSGYKIYGQEQVIKGDSRYGDYYINEEKYKELESCTITKGDLLISLVGTIGKTLVIPEDYEPGIINPRLIKISLHDKINPYYIATYFESYLAKMIMSEGAHGGTMQILNMSILRKLPIPLPPKEEQDKILEVVNNLLDVELATKQIINIETNLANLKQSILSKAFRGELGTNDPTEESAIELLKEVLQEQVK